MNFDQADALAQGGALIRRSLWDSYHTRTPDGGLRFVLPKRLAKSLGENYEPTDSDMDATDWQAKDVAQTRAQTYKLAIAEAV